MKAAKIFGFHLLVLALGCPLAPLAAQQVRSTITPMHPCRLYDSRLPEGSPPLVKETIHQMAVRGVCGVPESANSILVTAVAVGATGPGNVKIWASDLLAPVSSSFNFRGNGADSSATVVRLCAPPIDKCTGVGISVMTFFNDSHVIIDIVGYTEPLDAP